MKSNIKTVTVLWGILFFTSLSGADNCQETIELYNTGTLSESFQEKVSNFKAALHTECSNKEIISKIHNNLANTYENNGMLQKAIREYKKSIAIKPDLPTPYISLGDVYAKMNHEKESGKYYAAFLKLSRFQTKEDLLQGLSLRSATRSLTPVPSRRLYFGFDDADLTGESELQLKELLAALNDDELRSYQFQLSGHTCSHGSEAYNQLLSESRAQAVQKWLLMHDYPEKQLVTMGFGEKIPYADNGTEAGRMINRRVEIKTIGITLKARRSANHGERKAQSLIQNGLELSSQNKKKQAVENFIEAYEVSRRNNFSSGITAALGNLYLIYLDLSQVEKARECLDRLMN